jgi:membrane-associated phospholipid phosphatase
MAKKTFLKWIDLSGLFIFPVLGFIYDWLNENHQDAVTISTAFDSHIPFLPIFIIPYIIWYVYLYGYLLYFWWKDRKVYWRSIIAITLAELICFIIYYFFQTTVPRPNISGDGLLLQLVDLIYNSDEPVNCFPSIHVVTTCLIMFFSLHIKGFGKTQHYITQIAGTLVILSTLFVKQHVIYDVAGSMILSSGLYGLLVFIKLPVLKIERKKREEYQTY